MPFKVKPIHLLSLCLVIPTAGLAENIIHDSFESGDMSAPGGGNFSWANNNRSSVVTMDPGPLEVWQNGKRNAPDSDQSKDWTAYDGDFSLRFRYPANKEWSEQRFDIGDAYPEIWMSFWLRVPTNFLHERNNQKLFALWMDGYSSKGDGSTVSMEFRPDGSGGSVFYAKTSKGKYNVSGRDQSYMPFISVPEDRGRWMNIVVKVVAESKEDASDGTIEVWRKWAGESYVKTHDRTKQPIRLPSSGPQGIRRGYLMGYANGPYKVDTEFLIDDFRLSTESLLGAESNAPARPSAPANVTTR